MTAQVRRRALVVDDVPANRRLAVLILGKLGWTVAEVEGGQAALDRLAVDPDIDLLLLDISMPDLCGEDVCLQLRANPQFASLPIIAYTAHALPADADRFLASGFNAVLVKPISVKGVDEAIGRLFSTAG